MRLSRTASHLRLNTFPLLYCGQQATKRLILLGEEQSLVKFDIEGAAQECSSTRYAGRDPKNQVSKLLE